MRSVFRRGIARPIACGALVRPDKAKQTTTFIYMGIFDTGKQSEPFNSPHLSDTIPTADARFSSTSAP
jgi:hypothetical protein